MRRFTTRLLIAAAAIGGGYAAARVLAPAAWSLAQSGDERPIPASPISVVAPNITPGVPSEGNRIVLACLEALERRPIAVARMRQSLAIGDQQLSGEGRYWQQGVGNQRRSRWELKTLVAGEQAFFTQVYSHFPEGEFVWTDRRLPYSRTITRVDVAWVRRELGAAEEFPDAPSPSDRAVQAELLARGGLSQLFAELNRTFDFGPPQSLRHGEQATLALVGQWRPSELARQWPSAAAGGEWPAHLPHHVLVEIGAVDRFPYLVEYRRAAEAELAASDHGAAPAASPLARYEFFDVNFAAAMPERVFEFSPADFDWQDVTAQVIQRLRSGDAQATKTAELTAPVGLPRR